MDVKEMVKERKRISKAIKNSIRINLFKILDNLKDKDLIIDGLNIEELSRKLLKKSYVTDKDKKYIYGMLKEYRKGGKDLICYKRKYGYGNIEQTALYFESRDRIIDGYIEGRNSLANSAASRLGIDFPFRLSLEDKKTNLVK